MCFLGLHCMASSGILCGLLGAKLYGYFRDCVGFLGLSCMAFSRKSMGFTVWLLQGNMCGLL